MDQSTPCASIGEIIAYIGFILFLYIATVIIGAILIVSLYVTVIYVIRLFDSKYYEEPTHPGLISYLMVDIGFLSMFIMLIFSCVYPQDVYSEYSILWCLLIFQDSFFLLMSVVSIYKIYIIIYSNFFTIFSYKATPLLNASIDIQGSAIHYATNVSPAIAAFQLLGLNRIVTILHPPFTAAKSFANKIQVLPTDQQHSINSEECHICQCFFKEGERVKMLANCKHLYHVKCINAWLCSKNKCPLCKSVVI